MIIGLVGALSVLHHAGLRSCTGQRVLFAHPKVGYGLTCKPVHVDACLLVGWRPSARGTVHLAGSGWLRARLPLNGGLVAGRDER